MACDAFGKADVQCVSDLPGIRLPGICPMLQRADAMCNGYALFVWAAGVVPEGGGRKEENVWEAGGTHHFPRNPARVRDQAKRNTDMYIYIYIGCWGMGGVR